MPAKQSFAEGVSEVASLWSARPLIRAANFHNTPRTRQAEFDAQLRHWSECFSSVNEEELDQYLKTGGWYKKKPGLIVAMYNGYRDNYDVLRPILERYGLVGWFFVPTAFVCAAASEQVAFAASRTLRIVADEYRDGRYALNWSELRSLDQGHVVASHTRNHSQLVKEDSAELEGEIVGPQHDFEAHLGHHVRSFASLSGAPYGDHATVDRLIDAARYQFVFSNLKIQRLRDSAAHPFSPGWLEADAPNMSLAERTTGV